MAGELSRASGLGEGARLMLRALEARGVPAWPLDIGPLLLVHAVDMPPLGGPAGPPPGAALVLHVNAPLLPLVLTRLPRTLMQGRRVVGFWVWELPLIPSEWRFAARLLHDVWTPSRFSAAALAPICAGPVQVVPYPLAAALLAPARLGRGDFSLPEAAVVVLVSFNLASSFARKNPLPAIAAFRAAFGDRPDRILLLKISHSEHDPEDFTDITAAASAVANIRLETRTLPSADSLTLTAPTDMVLSLHRSEGVGLVPEEAMVFGKPEIATGWSGNLDFMDETCAALVRYRLMPVNGSAGGVWRRKRGWGRGRRGGYGRLATTAGRRPVGAAALGVAGQVMARERLGATPLEAVLRALRRGGPG